MDVLSLENENWYHGTYKKFESWEFPPPHKPNSKLMTKHNAIFFTTSLKYVLNIGNSVAKIKLIKKDKILNITKDKIGSENLRNEVKKDKFISKFDNIKKDIWDSGWRNGKVLRLQGSNIEAKYALIAKVTEISNSKNMNIEEAADFFSYDSARLIIEVICNAAKDLGYDAIIGNESDIDEISGRKYITWLAVLNSDVISTPEWLN